MCNQLTQDKLKEILEYNHETGIFTRRISTRKTGAGEIAGGNSRGYIQIAIDKRPYLAHRLAWLYMTGEMPKIIDHINRIKNDNRWCNLRNVSTAENIRNSGLSKRNKSGIKGVYWNSINKNWRVTCMFNLKIFQLGSYKCIEDAKAAYQNFIKSHHGEVYFEQ